MLAFLPGYDQYFQKLFGIQQAIMVLLRQARSNLPFAMNVAIFGLNDRTSAFEETIIMLDMYIKVILISRFPFPGYQHILGSIPTPSTLFGGHGISFPGCRACLPCQ